ncbi:DUF1493 family protein, partial [Salmonella enterica]|uniref:DUF1493 family protein n=1 Tax=Salmonella enterica TaxID=28901 RepID=UPI0020CB0906
RTSVRHISKPISYFKIHLLSGISGGQLNILNYLNPEYFGSKETDPRKPLTVGMLVESAKAGRWLYS